MCLSNNVKRDNIERVTKLVPKKDQNESKQKDFTFNLSTAKELFLIIFHYSSSFKTLSFNTDIL